MNDDDFDEVLKLLESEVVKQPKSFVAAGIGVLIARLLQDISKSLKVIAQNTTSDGIKQ